MADNTRWLHPQGRIRISKADGNLYMHDLDTNRVKVAQLDRLIDIRTDKGNSAVVIDTGHTVTSTVMHGFQFKTQEARDKFIADVMEVLVGNVPFIEYPSLPKTITIDLKAEVPPTMPILPLPLAREVALDYLRELVRRWKGSWTIGASYGQVRLSDVEAFIKEEQEAGKWSTDLHDLIVEVERVVYDDMSQPRDRTVMINYALMTLKDHQVSTKDFRLPESPSVA